MPDEGHILPTREEMAQQERDRQEWEDRKYNRLQFWFNVALSIATVGTLAVLIHQSYVLTDQNLVLKQSFEEMRRQSDATEKAALAAVESVGVAKEMYTLNKKALEQNREQNEETLEQSQRALDASIETARLDLRAQIGTTAGKLTRSEGDSVVSVGLIVSNKGKTFAFDVASIANLGLFKRSASRPRAGPNDKILNAAIESHHGRPVDGIRSNGVVPPGSNVITSPQIDLKTFDVTWKQIEDGEIGLILLGDVDYRDVFNEPHVTEYCGVYEHDTGTFSTCERHAAAR